MSSQITGKVLDFYDDPDGWVVRSYFPPERVPLLWKEATYRPYEEVPDEDFALLLKIKGKDTLFRKYAMYDEASTTLSAFYFEACGHRLPEEARKRAAEKIAAALEAYGYKPGEYIAKTAGLRTWGEEDYLEKLARMSMTPTPTLEKLPALRDDVVEVEDVTPVHKMAAPRPASPENYALVKRGQAKYPIHLPELVKQAMEYFVRYRDQMPLEDRHQYAVKVANRATEMGIPVHPLLQSYMGFQKRAEDEVRQAIIVRRHFVVPDERGILEKLASVVPQMPPEGAVMMIAKVDMSLGLDEAWDREVPNPIETVFRTVKEAAAQAREANPVLWNEDNLHMTAVDLLKGLRDSAVVSRLRKTLRDDIVDGLMKEPVSVFKSLPDPHKILIVRVIKEQA